MNAPHSGDARATALRVLTACRTNGAWADASLSSWIARDGLDRADSALCSRIVYGVLQNEQLLDFYLSAYCTQKLDHLQPPLAEILRIGGYQILFLDKVPDSAAVNTSVELAKRWKREQAAGLVNAVLRALSRNRDRLPEIPERNQVQYLSIRYSHPKWMVKRLLALLGREETEAFLASDNSQPPIAVQVNTLRFDTAQVKAALEAQGVQAETHPWLADCLLLSGTGNLERLDAFRNGAFYVQDPAARLAVLAAGLHPGDRVLDVCAAPGGKSFAAAIAMEDRGEIVACDLHENKLKRIREGADRLGLGCIQTAAADGRIPRQEWAERFDTVMVDAPCSGLGIIRKKPDIRRRKADDLFPLPAIQTAILDNAAGYVRSGGTLLYSTCTILPEENQQITDAFLANHPDFSRESFRLPFGESEEGQQIFWPHRLDTDGFYICRMRRE